MTACLVCGRENADDARFCSGCGSALAPAEGPREVRKTVTVVFSDVVGSTAVGERLDPESLRHVMGRYFDAMSVVLERHGGTVEKFIGDAIMAVFGIPQVHEDDALRAVRAAAEMREELQRLNLELERDYGVTISNRTGVNTGEVVAGDPAGGQRLVTGDAVNVAARLEQAAPEDEILLGEPTHALVREAVRVEAVEPIDAKGKSARVAAYRLVEVLGDVPAFTRRLDAPFVGRDAELAALRDAFELAVGQRTCHAVTVLGPPGIGKSRLVRELLSETADRARILVGRCLPYGEGITYWPLGEIVKQLVGEDDGALAKLLDGVEEAPAISQNILAAVGRGGTGGSAEDTQWAVRRLLETLARETPVIVVLDDLHWAEPGFHDLVEYVLAFSTGAPILLACVARAELLEVRPSWAITTRNARSILLEPLAERDSSNLVERLVGEEELDPELRDRILAAAEGNPLFVEQMLAMRADSSGELTVPPTIQALLAARVDRLEADERSVMERGSVEGRLFHRTAVSELAPESVRPAVGSHLLTLVRKELIRPDRAEFPGDDAFRFGHILIRDAAYEAMPKELRADLHERYADWLERVLGERVAEYQEILAHHLEQAHDYLAALGPLDDRGIELGRRAAERLEAAAKRAHNRLDTPAAARLLERAVATLPVGSAERAELLPYLGQMQSDAGRWDDALATLREAADLATRMGHATLGMRVEIERLDIETFVDPQGWADRCESISSDAIAVFERADDSLGLARAKSLLGHAQWMRCRTAEAQKLYEEAAQLFLDSGEEAQYTRILVHIGGATVIGPMPVEEGLRRHEEFAERLALHPVQRAGVQAGAAQLLAMNGRIDDARALFAESRAVRENFQVGVEVASSWNQIEAEIARRAADYRVMADAFLRGAAALEEQGEVSYRSTMLAEAANALTRLGDYDEAWRLAVEAAEIGASDDRATQGAATVARAQVLAARGELDDAEALAREAIEGAESTDFLTFRGHLWLALARILSTAGRRDEAGEAGEAALRLYEQKGDVPMAAEARAFLEAIRAGMS